MNQEIPYRRAYKNEIGLTFYVDAKYEIVEFFEGWVDYMSGLGSTLGKRNTENHKLSIDRTIIMIVHQVVYF